MKFQFKTLYDYNVKIELNPLSRGNVEIRSLYFNNECLYLEGKDSKDHCKIGYVTKLFSEVDLAITLSDEILDRFFELHSKRYNIDECSFVIFDKDIKDFYNKYAS